jgi:signal transduction histidine kinase
MTALNGEIIKKSYYPALALLSAGLVLIGLKSFPEFHMVMELVSMAVAFSIIIITWNVRGYQKDGYLLFIGIFFLFTGVMDVFQFLSYKEMGAPGEIGRNISMQLWIAGRIIQSVSFAVSPFFLDRKIKIPETLAIYSAMSLFAGASIFWWRIFPDCYIEGSGLTYFKIVSECLIILVFIASIPLLLLKRHKLDGNVPRLLVLSISFFTIAEIVFAPLAGYSGLLLTVADLFRLTGYFFAWRAVIEMGVSGPYESLLRNATMRENALERRTAEVVEANRRLEKLNNILEEKLEEEVNKNRDMDFMLIQQCRLAAMGEMIGNIAHQWRQPLNAVSLIIQDLEECYECGEFNGDYLKASVRQAMDVIAHMSQTINDFRNFLKPNKEELHFSVKETIQRALNFVAGSFNDCNIRVEVDMENDVLVCGQSNDYSQVILNILNNAREACVDRQVADARIAVHLFKNNDKSVVTITDNAGGIPEEIIGKVFDPYFSTKESGGTGIGLYMSKTIIEKNMKGRLSVRNNGNGAEFRIEV